MYLGINYLYKRYIEDLNNIDIHTIHAQRRITELEREVKMNRQMINWLCDEVAKYKLSKAKEGKKK